MVIKSRVVAAVIAALGTDASRIKEATGYSVLDSKPVSGGRAFFLDAANITIPKYRALQPALISEFGNRLRDIKMTMFKHDLVPVITLNTDLQIVR